MNVPRDADKTPQVPEPAQTFSHYPAIPPPVSMQLWESGSQPCPYLPGRISQMRALVTDKLASQTYHAFMDANFRRSGRIIYQPSCAGCRACQSLRVIVQRFQMSKSQRRCWRKNGDLTLSVAKPEATEEKFDLYRRYLSEWHGRAEANRDGAFADFSDFLCESPVDSLEFAYRDATGKLLAVGICDVSPSSLSSVYFYFDPSESDRSLGTFGAMQEIDWAAKNRIDHYYLGYWVERCAAMSYKSSFDPHEILCTDGVWREQA